ncbi:MAG: hypothetical protein AB8G11_16240 [Saprospiraceae bacterium]
MRKVLLIGLLFILPTLIFAQNKTTPTIDERLYEVFEKKFLERLQQKTPATLEYYNFFLDNAYKIQPLSNDKTSDYPDVIIEDLDDFNILKLINNQELKRDYNYQKIYKIADCNQLLILISEKELVKQFNQYTGRTH